MGTTSSGQTQVRVSLSRFFIISLSSENFMDSKAFLSLLISWKLEYTEELFSKNFYFTIPELNWQKLSSLVDDTDDAYESGSGSGSGIDDEDDDDSGSGKLSTLTFWQFVYNKFSFSTFLGLGTYTDEIQPAIPPQFNPIDPGTRHVNVHDVNRNNIDDEHSSETPGDPDITEHSRESKPTSGASSSREWRAKRLIITYFLPIVMAWFGGSISGAVADLLWFYFKKFLSRQEDYFSFVN